MLLSNVCVYMQYDAVLGISREHWGGGGEPMNLETRLYEA